MKKESIPFGGAMKMKAAFCNGIGIDISQMKRLIWISGQLSFDEQENFIGKGDMRVQTDQVLKNIKNVLEKRSLTEAEGTITGSFPCRPASLERQSRC